MTRDPCLTRHRGHRGGSETYVRQSRSQSSRAVLSGRSFRMPSIIATGRALLSGTRNCDRGTEFYFHFNQLECNLDEPQLAGGHCTWRSRYTGTSSVTSGPRRRVQVKADASDPGLCGPAPRPPMPALP